MSSAMAAAPAPIAGQKLEDKFFQIPVDALEPSASNPRKRIAQEELQELAQSISTSGVLQPLTVRPIASDRYEIVIGERRWRAAKLARQTHVPCLVRMLTAAAALEAQIIENLQRRDVSPLEEAASYEALLKATNSGGGATKLGVSDIAARIGKSPRYVYDRLELMKLTPFVTEALDNGKISAGHASEIARLDPKLQDDVTRVAARADMSVMQLREFIREAKRGNASPALVEKPVLQTSAKPAPASASAAKASLAAIERALKKSLHDVRFQFGLNPSQLAIFRSFSNNGRAEFAVFVQTSAKPRKRGAHGNRRTR